MLNATCPNAMIDILTDEVDSVPTEVRRAYAQHLALAIEPTLRDGVLRELHSRTQRPYDPISQGDTAFVIYMEL